MCVPVQTGKGNSDAVRITHACHDSALTFDLVLDGLRDIVDDPSNGRLPSAEDQITNFHSYMIPKISGKVKIYFR